MNDQNAEKKILKKQMSDEKLIQTYNLFFAVVFVVSGYLIPLSMPWFKPLACIAGSLYTIINTKAFYFILSSLQSSSANKIVGVLLAIVKFPILLLLVYLAAIQGEGFLWSALIGVFVFVPSALVYCFRLLSRKEEQYQ